MRTRSRFVQVKCRWGKHSMTEQHSRWRRECFAENAASTPHPPTPHASMTGHLYWLLPAPPPYPTPPHPHLSYLHPITTTHHLTTTPSPPQIKS
ncbi:unnamed protein product [Mesocestoides corti]|uniref:Uncharacterized protein n=2 Tax=Mesocestoides corti TaxID=53468 RepID=A0A0R3UBQ8_MESCO|nr:unnamed protein product [Mesocestoides corti]